MDMKSMQQCDVNNTSKHGHTFVYAPAHQHLSKFHCCTLHHIQIDAIWFLLHRFRSKKEKIMHSKYTFPSSAVICAALTLSLSAMIRYQLAIISLYFDLVFACVREFANSKSFIIGDDDNDKCVIIIIICIRIRWHERNK